MGLLDRFKRERASRPDACTIEALARLRARPDVHDVEAVDADTLAVRWEPGAESDEVSLDDLRARWTGASGFDRIAVMDAWVDGVSAAPDTPAPGIAADPSPDTPVAARIIIVVSRNRPPDGAPWWPVTEHLSAHLALDDAGALAVTEAQLDEWGVDLDTARGWAVANQAAQDPGLDPLDTAGTAWVVTAPGHRAGWLCTPEHLLGPTGLTEAVVLVPTPNELVVVDPADADMVGSIVENTLVILEEEVDLCWPAPLLVRAAGGADVVAEWQPPPDHPGAELARELTRRSRELD